MLPPDTTVHLKKLGHDALSVRDVDLTGADDSQVLALAVAENRIMVTENFSDYSALLDLILGRDDPCVPVVFVRKSDFPRRGALASHLAARLDQWASDHPDPYIGPHWP